MSLNIRRFIIVTNPPQDPTNQPRIEDQPVARPPRTTPTHLDVGFNLFDPATNSLCPITEEQELAIWNQFPGTQQVWLGPIGITIHVDHLPPRPHPKTIGNVPLWITDDDDDLGFAKITGRPRSGDPVLEHLGLPKKLSIPQAAVEEIFRHFEALSIPLRCIESFFGDLLICTLETKYPGSLPSAIGARWCLWKVYTPQRAKKDAQIIEQLRDCELNGNRLVEIWHPEPNKYRERSRRKIKPRQSRQVRRSLGSFRRVGTTEVNYGLDGFSNV